MALPTPARPPLVARWDAGDAGSRYATRRWRSARAAARDPRMVARALREHGRDLAGGNILDIPCGTGRLRRVLEGTGARVVGADVSRPMLERAAGARAQATAWRLPFGTATFDAVVCCRLVHHLRGGAEREALLRELVRVSRDLVLVSFWDAASLHAWRRRHGLRRRAHSDPRAAIRRSDLERELAAAGAAVLAYEHSLRFVSQQAFAVARVTRG